jgi:hypothetical protein
MAYAHLTLGIDIVMTCTIYLQLLPTFVRLLGSF